jgi:heat shock protein beta
LGVSETAETDTRVKPAPPVDPVLKEEETKEHHFQIPAELKEKFPFITMEEIDDEGNPIHDEL